MIISTLGTQPQRMFCFVFSFISDRFWLMWDFRHTTFNKTASLVPADLQDNEEKLNTDFSDLYTNSVDLKEIYAVQYSGGGR